MQWILQRYDDTEKLAAALDRLGLPYSFHKVVPFVGDLHPAPEIKDPSKVLLFRLLRPLALCGETRAQARRVQTPPVSL